MPSFYAADSAGRLPLTPPEYHPTYAISRTGDARLVSQMSYAAQPHLSAYPDKDPAEYADRYGRPPTYTATGPMMYPPMQAPPQQPPPPPTGPVYDAYYPPGYGHRQQMYGPVAAPVLPSMCANEPVPTATRDRLGSNYPSLPEPTTTTTAAEPPKEEKHVGGVAAYLDYDMDQMVAFVAEMAQRMYDLYRSRICLADIDIARSVQSTAPVSPAFRKFVSQILTSTRLPRSTILLALHYLAARMTVMSSRNEASRGSSGQVYRMLTIALLLGSKFLDDNTFQNRSWSDVSGLAVRELSTLEREWLIAMGYNLHVDPLEDQGFAIMSEQWRQWLAKRTAKSTAAPQLAPIDTTVSNYHARPRLDRTPVPRYTLPKPNPGNMFRGSVHQEYLPSLTASYEHGWNYRAQVEYSPPSAPETGPSTPDYGVYASRGHNPPSAQYAVNYPMPLAAPHPPVYHRPSYPHQPPLSIWAGHRTSCACAQCVRPHEPYFAGYGPQPVAG